MKVILSDNAPFKRLSMTPIAVTTTTATRREEAQQLAVALNLPFITDKTIHYPLLLVLTEECLELRDVTQPRVKPIFVDFLSGKLKHRQRYGGGRGQLIARAIGLKPKQTPTVLDLTAGLGEDAFILTTLGCFVTMVERHPVMAALLRDGLLRLPASTPALYLVEQNGLTYLQALPLENYPDVIYIDPMFPDQDKSALAKKEMRIVRKLVGMDDDADALLPIARTIAQKRVVVKRARYAPTLANATPDIVFKGRSGRWDVYLCTARIPTEN